MREPIRRLHKRRAASNFGVRYVDVVGGTAKRNLLFESEAWQATFRVRRRLVLFHPSPKSPPFPRTLPTNRTPWRGFVRRSSCCPPLSPIALRTALIRLSSVESETIRPPQTDAIRSSLLTTRLRFSIR